MLGGRLGHDAAAISVSSEEWERQLDERDHQWHLADLQGHPDYLDSLEIEEQDEPTNSDLADGEEDDGRHAGYPVDTRPFLELDTDGDETINDDGVDHGDLLHQLLVSLIGLPTICPGDTGSLATKDHA